jgi:flavorubredoxin
LAKSDINDIVTEIFKSKTVVLGSPTIGKQYSSFSSGIYTLYKKYENLRIKKQQHSAVMAGVENQLKLLMV